MTSFCKDGMHERVAQDAFAKLPGVKRHVPGDCVCLDCKQPLAAWWNRGNPEPIDQPENRS